MPSESDLRKLAVEYFQKAYERQMHGEYDEAIALYTQSIEAYPTAEAYTFRGWSYSFLGNHERAIADCLEAIKVDPEFGNPYNDHRGVPDRARQVGGSHPLVREGHPRAAL